MFSLRSVWQKLEEENSEFFRAYYIRLKLKKQIILFNHLLQHQYNLMKYPSPPNVPLAPIQNGIHHMPGNIPIYNSITENDWIGLGFKFTIIFFHVLFMNVLSFPFSWSAHIFFYTVSFSIGLTIGAMLAQCRQFSCYYYSQMHLACIVVVDKQTFTVC